MRPGQFVAVAGNIGVGKTHLTTLLANRLGWRAYYEPVIDNPYLDDFYADMTRWAFHLQVYFLSKRFEIHRDMVRLGEPCIQDRTIYEDKEIFAATLHRQGFMADRDYANYVALFDAMTSFLRVPDLVVYLRADVPSLFERIRCRGRDCEKEISAGYLDALNSAYDDWSARAARATSVLTLETDGVDLVSDEGAIEETLDRILCRLGGAPACEPAHAVGAGP
ncbi:MAG: deoxynucleoside kinase [Candidatus Eisenbacteria bacterium]|nr:deoxynucleoside kinase [Candidatus Eisenbacteria bacterium]